MPRLLLETGNRARVSEDCRNARISRATNPGERALLGTDEVFVVIERADIGDVIKVLSAIYHDGRRRLV